MTLAVAEIGQSIFVVTRFQIAHPEAARARSNAPNDRKKTAVDPVLRRHGPDGAGLCSL
jgi:hypothetical protein